ncbi:tetratricopeptide repeat protein [Streptomyces anulatus]|uniref:tetratricopeptide repeat protein n=1 Tax=Streptomyces anulatus TaxID=1892 RepID=UPI003333B00E
MAVHRARLMAVTGPGGPGSGYLVGPRLVLTSAHVVGRPGGSVSMFRPGHDAVSAGTVVWSGTPGGRNDAALVRIDEAAWQPPTGAVVRWGRLVTERPGQRCEAWGAPDVVQRPGAAVEVMQLAGSINPGSGFVGNRYVIELSANAPLWRADGTSPWGGLSGAAMFCGRLLTGVVAAAQTGSGHGTLTAVPAYALHHDEEFRAALAEHGVGSMALEAVEFQDLAESDAATPPSGLGAPAALLQARRQVVDFHGREDLLARLVGWSTQEGFGAWLLHGPAGQGKTRVAYRLAALLTTRGWAVLWPRPDATAADIRTLREAGKPLLVVMDYAETRPAQLSALTAAAAEHSGATPFKVLLLARTAGDWWDGARAASRAAEELLEGSPVVALPRLQPDAEGRPDAYRQARGSFAAAMPGVRGGHERDWTALAASLPVPDLTRPGLDNALTLHMTALVDLLDAAEPPPSPECAATVEDRLLLHERRYWEQYAAACGLLPALTSATLQDALAAAALAGAADGNQADAVLRTVIGLADQPRDRRDAVLSWIAALYPPAASGPWGVLQPDRLVERLVGRRLADDPLLAHRLVPYTDSVQAVRLLTLYSRAAAYPAFGGRLDTALSELCVRHHVVLAPHVLDTVPRVEHPAPLITALRQLTEDEALPLSELQQLHDRLPYRSERLAPWAADLTRQLVDRYRELSEEAPERSPSLAALLTNLSNRLANLGRRQEALDAAREAVRIHRPDPSVRWMQLSRAVSSSTVDLTADQAARLSGYAGSLVCLSNRLVALGQWDEALDAAEEAGLAYRSLVGIQPDMYRREYATSLNNLGNRLAGRPERLEDAVDTLREAVRVRRDLAAASPDSDLPDLAMSLGNLALRLVERGHREEAVHAAREALTLTRSLAEVNPDAHLPLLASHLEVLSRPLGELGHHEEALSLVEESVDIQRTLVSARPEAHLRSLGHSLNSLAQRLADSDRRKAALAAMEEAVCIFRSVASRYPDAHLPDLAMGLNNLGPRLNALGRRSEALAAVEESLQIRRTLPHAHLTAEAQYHLALQLHEDGRRKEAVSAVKEAVRLRPRTTLYRDFQDLIEHRGLAAMLRLGSRLTATVFLWRYRWRIVRKGAAAG